MPDEVVTFDEAKALADNLAAELGEIPLARRVASLERDCHKASRLIRAMLRQVHSSDVFHLPEK